MEKRQIPLYIKITAIILAIYFGWQLLVLAKNILIPVVIAWLIALVFFPIQAFMERKWKLPRAAACMVCILIVISFLTGFVFFIGTEATAFSADLSMLAQKFNTNSLSPSSDSATGNNQWNALLSRGINTLFTALSSLAGKLLISLMSTVITIVLIVVFTFFFLYYRRLLYNAIAVFFGDSQKASFEKALLAIRKLTRHFITGLLIEMLVVAILNAVLLTVFGIKHGIMLGILAAVLNVIPYVGIYSATLLAVLITYGNTGSMAAITTAIIFLAVHTVDANILMPRIMGSQVKLNSFAALISVLTGGLLWGIPGLFLAIPVAAIARIIFEQVPSLMPFAVIMGSENKKSDMKE